MKQIWVYDLEIFKNFHSATFMNRDTLEIKQFIIHYSKNELKEYIEFLNNEVSGLIGFNNIGFDYPLLHYLLTQPNLYNKSSDIITNELYLKAQELIHKEGFSTIPEWNMIIPQLDLYKINHFDNAAKRQSLKGLEITMKLDNVEDLPFSFNHYVLDDEIDKILSYNLWDVKATYQFYLKCINQIEMRKSLSKEYGLNLINANDPKIGSEIFAKLLSQNLNIPIKELKQLRTERPTINLNECLLPYITFTTNKFNNLLNSFKNKIITETKGSIEYSIIYNEIKLFYGTGGIHGSVIPGIYKADDNYIIADFDVNSYYPNLAIQNNFKPEHLGDTFNKVYKEIYDKRVIAKKEGNKVVNEGLKLALNGKRTCRFKISEYR